MVLCIGFWFWIIVLVFVKFVHFEQVLYSLLAFFTLHFLYLFHFGIDLQLINMVFVLEVFVIAGHLLGTDVLAPQTNRL